jgi:hypothetical protein
VAQKRVFYPCQGVLFLERNDNTGNQDIGTATFLTGVQNVGVNGSLPSSSLADLGRFQRRWKFDNVGQREFSITIERYLNKGDDTFYKTNSYSSEYTTNHLLYHNNLGVQGNLNSSNKSLKNYDIVIIYGPDDQDRLDTNNSLTNVTYRNCLITNLSYEFSVDGYVTESITLISKRADYNAAGSYTLPVESAPQDGNVVKRQDIDFAETVLPDEAENIFKDAVTDTENGQAIIGLQSISIEMSVNYEELDDVGVVRGADTIGEDNLWKFVSVPVEISCSFTGISRAMYPLDNMEVEDVKFPNDKIIKIVADSIDNGFYIWDLGKKNYLDSISVSGGDTGGGNVELTLSYRNDYSDLVIARNATVHNVTQTRTY